MKHEGWFRASRDLGVELPEDRLALLARFEALLIERAVPLGLIASADRARLRDRHILDSLRGAPLVPPNANRAYDLGSGAGLPGVPMAIARPDLAIVLAESRRARGAFLELVIESLPLPNARVHVGGVAELVDPAEVCLARAFAGPERCWRVARRLLVPGGVLLYWAGEHPVAPFPGVSWRSFRNSGLAHAGPIVMMSQL